MVKKILQVVLGAGAGYLGTVIRTAAAAVGGYFLSKGWVDEGTSTALVEHVAGIGLVILAAIGSYLNNEAKDGESN